MTFVPSLVLLAALATGPEVPPPVEAPLSEAAQRREDRAAARMIGEVGFGLVGGLSLGVGLGAATVLTCPFGRDRHGCWPSAYVLGGVGVLVGHALGVGLGGFALGEDFSFWRPLLGAVVGAAVGAGLWALGSSVFALIAFTLPLAGAVVAYESFLPALPDASVPPVPPSVSFAFRF